MMVPTMSRRRATSSGVARMMSFGTAMSCSATRISSCLARFEPVTGMMTNKSTSLPTAAVPRACEPNRMI